MTVRRKPEWRDRPLALYGEASRQLFVVAANPPAMMEGVAPGMTLATARALVADLVTQKHSSARQAGALRSLARWAERFSPAVARDGQDGLLLDMTGAARVFGGEPVFMARLQSGLAEFRLEARTALAPTPAAAWGLARYGEPGQIVTGETVEAALAPLPVAALNIPGETARKLGRLGLTTVRDLLALPRPSLTRRFGLEVATRLDQALGGMAEPLSPWRPPPPPRAAMAFEEPLIDRTGIEAALATLTDRLIQRLTLTGDGADAIAFAIERVDGGRQTVMAGAASPTRDPARIARMLAEKLDALDLGFGVQRAFLEATRASPLASAQREAFAAKAADERLTRLIDRLGDRLGFDAVAVYAPEPRWQPERGHRLVPAGGSLSEAPWPPAPGPRPLRLLQRRLAVDVRATGDDPLSPPAAIRRGPAWRPVVDAAGPERIAPEWRDLDLDWPATRDYWRVQTGDGERLWIYRTGQRWFLHGFFP